MEHRNLELTLVSAEGMKDINLVGKMDLYAVAYLVGNPKTKQKTGVDKNCGTTPRWNHKMKFTLDDRSISSPPGSTLFIQIMAEKFGPDKDVGEVSLNILELFESAKSTIKEGKEGGETEKQFADYQIKGKGKGTLKISYTFGEKFSQDVKSKNIDPHAPAMAYPPAAGGYGQAGSSMPPQHMGYPPNQGYPVGGPQPGYPPNQGYPMGGPPPGYPPNQGYPMGGPPPHQPGYPDQSKQGGYPGYGAPAPQGYGAPAPHGYDAPPPQGPGGYYPAPGGYGGPPPQQPYGYAGHNQHAAKPKKKKKGGMGGMGMGLGAGLLGGLLIGDMIGDVGEAAAYADGYGDAMGDVGDVGFDF